MSWKTLPLNFGEYWKRHGTGHNSSHEHLLKRIANDAWCECEEVMNVEIDALKKENEILMGKIQEYKIAISAIDVTLRCPAAEYVPAIGDAFKIIDQMIKRESKAQKSKNTQ